MPRKKRGELKRMPIDLDMDDARQRELWEYWLLLTAEGKGSKWVRDTLIAALPSRPKGIPPKQTSVRGNGAMSEVHYEAVDE